MLTNFVCASYLSPNVILRVCLISPTHRTSARYYISDVYNSILGVETLVDIYMCCMSVSNNTFDKARASTDTTRVSK